MDRNQFLFAFLLAALGFLEPSQTATTHKHVPGSRERAEDGGYSPRDAHHHEGGEHHSEFDHEAILGSVKEAEEFDSLTPEESKKRLAILVTKMDLNKDQFIDRHEMKAWIMRSFKTLSEEEAAERFEEIDENADGKITWQEYMRDVFGADSENEKKDPLMNPQLEEEQKMMADDRDMFNAADQNKDGLLSPDEFVLFQTPEEHPEMLPLVLAQTLRDKDSNKDGLIDFKEFVAESANDQDKEWLITEKEKFDNDFDKDNDGYLNGNEILSWIIPSNDEVATEEVDHLFASADEDHDDRLSYQEIIDNYDTFVGSEVTDYGDHLQKIHQFNDEL